MSRSRLIQQAATLSFIAPLVAVTLVLAVRALPVALRARYFGMGFTLFIVVLLGLIGALFALHGRKQTDNSRVGFRAGVGLLANAAILLAMFVAFP